MRGASHCVCSDQRTQSQKTRVVLQSGGIWVLCRQKAAGVHIKTHNHYQDFLSFLFCVKKANLVNYFHLVHKVIILMLFTSMLKICSLVKMKVTLISPKAVFHVVMYIAWESFKYSLIDHTNYQENKRLNLHRYWSIYQIHTEMM